MSGRLARSRRGAIKPPKELSFLEAVLEHLRYKFDLPFYLLLIGKRINSYSISILTLKQVTVASDVSRNTEDTV